MPGQKQKRSSYDAQFKHEGLQYWKDNNNNKAAREIKIGETLIHDWKKSAAKNCSRRKFSHIRKKEQKYTLLLMTNDPCSASTYFLVMQYPPILTDILTLSYIQYRLIHKYINY